VVRLEVVAGRVLRFVSYPSGGSVTLAGLDRVPLEGAVDMVTAEASRSIVSRRDLPADGMQHWQFKGFHIWKLVDSTLTALVPVMAAKTVIRRGKWVWIIG
jgi:hypothetical protein